MQMGIQSCLEGRRWRDVRKRSPSRPDTRLWTDPGSILAGFATGGNGTTIRTVLVGNVWAAAQAVQISAAESTVKRRT
jgi:hypothetical protein